MQFWSRTYLDDHIHEVWYMFFYILVVEYHKVLEDKSLIHHNNKLIPQNLKQAKSI